MTDLNKEAMSIFLETAKSLSPAAVINERIALQGNVLLADREQIRLSDYTEIILIGFGKASISMGSVLEEKLGRRITKGVLVTPRRPTVKVNSEVIIAGHPLPDSNSLIAGEAIINALRSCGEQSLVIFLISGGGSALVESPLFEEITLEDIKDLNRILINCGASIHEINTVRKHLSKVKGGRLGFLTKDSKCIALYISDVNQGDMRSIASNPLLPDDLTLEDFFRVIEKFGLAKKLPPSISSLVLERQIPGLPRWVESEERRQVNIMLIENSDALRVAGEFARNLGYETRVDYKNVEGEYKSIARELILELANLQEAHANKKVCVISGGEVSCPVSGRGIGGRNQEFVLYAASLLSTSGMDNAVILSCGTDGIDGNSIATGAILSADAIRHTSERGIDLNSYFQANDSHSFFHEFGGLVVTGPAGNNIRDLRILVAGASSTPISRSQ